MSRAESFSTVFQNGTLFRPAIEARVISSSFDSLSIVSAAWKFFLVIAPEVHSSDFAHPQEWIPLIQRKRAEFTDLKSRFLVPPPSDDPTHPLDRSANSVWAQYFKDEELKTMIQRDIDRLYQTEPFFQDPSVLRAIATICFLHVRQFPSFPYQQGFHELCGVVYYLYHREMRDHDSQTPFGVLFSSSDVEADVFWSYAAVLELVEPYYRRCAEGEVSYLVERCDIIQKVTLAKYSPETAAALAANGVYPVQYLVPWLRVMFARLYGLDDAIKIWTRVFALGREALEAFAVAVLLALKDGIRAAPSAVEIYHTLMHSEPPPIGGVIAVALAEANAGRAASPASRVESICREMEEIVEREDWFEMPIAQITTAIAVFRDALRSLTAEEVRDPGELPMSVDVPSVGEESEFVPLPRAGDGNRRTLSILIRETPAGPPREDIFARVRGGELFQ
jgi:hypothetical protein